VLFFVAHHRFMSYLVKTGDHLGRLLAFLGLRVFADRYVVR